MGKVKGRPVAKAKAKAKAAKPAKAKPAKPAKAAAPPLPPPPPPPPAERDELAAPRDVARLLRYGERFGTSRIDVRMLPLQLPIASAALAIFDPAAPKSWRVFDRPTPGGQFRVMLSVAKTDKDQERLAAIVIHVGRPPIARWTVAHYRGQKKPKSADQLPRATTGAWLALVDAGTGAPTALDLPPPVGVAPVEHTLSDGRRALALPAGAGDYAAYWAVDAMDRPICLVVDFDVFSQKEWKAKSSG